MHSLCCSATSNKTSFFDREALETSSATCGLRNISAFSLASCLYAAARSSQALRSFLFKEASMANSTSRVHLTR